MVTVQLVENSVKSSVGTDIVVSLRLQYKMVDSICSIYSMNLAIRPSHEEGA